MKKISVTEEDIKNVQKIMKKMHKPVEHLFAPETPVFRGFDQPLPDVIGYSQHGGECASDSLQEILMFADGIRDFTQPILYNMTPTQITVRSKLSLGFRDWERFTDYLKFIQLRFRAHYDVLNYLRTEGISPRKYQFEKVTVCALNPLFRRKEALSAEGGILALKKLYKEETYTQSGMKHSETIKTIFNLLKWFGVPYELSGKDINTTKVIAIQIGLKNGYMKPDKTIYWYTSQGHATAFIKMMNKWYYYDDNYGIYPVTLDLINDFMNPALNCFIFVTFHEAVFTPYFVKGGVNPTHVWTPSTGWSTNLSKITYKGLLYGNGTIQKCDTPLIGIQPTGENLYRLRCKTGELGHASSTEAAIENVRKMVQCIYDNPHSNSAIFEDLYHYTFENLAHIHKNEGLYNQITSTLESVLSRPACSPMIHYWVWRLQTAILKKFPDDQHAWFQIPEFPKSRPGSFSQKPTPENVRKQMLKAEEERRKRLDDLFETPKQSPCPPGQVRNAKTKKCRDRKKPEPLPAGEEPKPKPKPVKRTPCPPGEIRNAKTKKCKPRIALPSPCPPGQVRDKKTKKCRDAKKLKLED